MVLDRELVEAVRLAREAGAMLRKFYECSGRGEIHTEWKSEGDPVTLADEEVNAFLVNKIRELFPTDAVIAEETPPSLHTQPGSPRCWYIDPLDGTKEFLARNGEFSVMIGLAIRGEAKLGVVYQPTEDILYRGVVGDGAFMEQHGKTYLLFPEEEPAEIRLVRSRSHTSPEIDELKTKLSITHEVPSGSVGLKVGLVASRKADLYVHFSNKTSAWDVCGPDAIMKAAGGSFTDALGRNIEYDGRTLKNHAGILACGPTVLDKVAPTVADIASKAGLAW